MLRPPMVAQDRLARRAAALLLALTSCAHATAPRLETLLAEGDLHGACRALERPELSQPATQQAARVALLRALAARERLTVALHVLGREELTRRLGFEPAPSFAERSLTLGLTVTSSAPVVHAAAQDFRIDGWPELLSAGDDGEGEGLERYVAALGGPPRPPFVPPPSTGVSDLVKLLAHAATFGVFLVFELGGGPRLSPDVSYVDASGRRVDWMSWFQLAEVRAAGQVHHPRWTLRMDENVPLSRSRPTTLTRGYTFLPWPREAAPETALYRYAWRVSAPATRAMAISAAGWIGVMSRSYLTVLDGASGRRITGDVELCEVVDDGLFLITPTRGIIVCRDALAEVGFPEVKLGATTSLPFEAEVAALGGDLIAVGGGRHVQLHRTSSLARIEAIELPVEVRSLALSADGQRLAIGASDGSTRIRRVGGGSEIVSQGDNTAARTLAFSPDGSRLFVDDTALSAHELDVTSGQPIGLEHRTGSWLTAARYLADDLVVTAGSDGLVLHRTGATIGQELVDPKTVEFGSYKHLAVSPDGRMVCGSDPRQRTICHTNGPIGASTLFDEWKPNGPPALVLGLQFELPGNDGACAIAGAFRLALPSAGSPREAIEAFAARGETPLTSADVTP